MAAVRLVLAAATPVMHDLAVCSLKVWHEQLWLALQALLPSQTPGTALALEAAVHPGLAPAIPVRTRPPVELPLPPGLLPPPLDR